MTEREALKLALEALELHLTHHEHGCVYLDPAVTAIKEALAQPEQEPVAWATMLGSYAHVSWGKDRPDYPIRYEVPLYTTPPAAQRQWVGLTDEEAKKAFAEHNCDISKDLAGILARAIEAKLKEKNT